MLPSTRLYEREHKLSLLLELGSMLAREVDLDVLLRALGSRIAVALHADRGTIYLLDASRGELITRVADLPELGELRIPLGKGFAGIVAETGEVINVRDAQRDPRHFAAVDQQTGYVTRTMLTAPIRDARRAIRGVVQVLNKRGGPFTEEDEAFVLTLGLQVAQALEGTSLRPEVTVERGVRVRGPFNHIVGASAPMKKVYELVQRAAAVDATVLLRGETGTGKGLIARAIHANCARSSGPLVTVDCTTLPVALVESELFGHERGAYTGADQRVQGKVEVARGGTLFLDEVGELPLTIQAKLLRFLQDRTFERVGGRSTITADVRVIAATHRDLEALVRKGEFRQDLFYRLRVVEITLPSLRERGGEELVSLAQHFLDVYVRRYHREGMKFSADALAVLRTHDWPGNVRELEHAVERAVVLASGTSIEAEHLGLVTGTRRSVPPPQDETAGQEQGTVTLPLGLSLEEVERRYVAATLEHHKGNRTHAAKALGVGRNTLKRKAKSSA